ncbi:RrF2 family transcriptional regulator [Limnoglobus roseus]|uniref:Rrf2 family transcriptional regulator n=1 Tax=Limnoglobus roseus TaxID=2598579 RepID=A0A5C1AQG1_9BACT|nr:Rrf2 family transcriptional regulator [Limnoglobus roseus]QEL19424.1 Rrf2 family transcriptional regulator [Limnoglobus roseus]
MTLLSRKADYALLILSHLYHHPTGGNARTIAEAFGLSRAFVANILKELTHAGYVASHRGVKGGYAMLRPANEVTLAELLESIEEGFKLTVCSSHSEARGEGTCSVSHVCPMKGPIAEIHRRLMGVLHGVTLEELFSANRAAASTTMLPLMMMADHPREPQLAAQ